MKTILIFLVAAALTGLSVIGGCASSKSAPPGESLLINYREEYWPTGQPGSVELTTKHYRIFTTVQTQSLRRYLPGFMEAAYLNYLRLTGLPDQPSREGYVIYMMASRREWASLTKTITGPAASLYLNIGAGGYCYKGVGVFWNIGGLGTMSVAAHEGLHQFFHFRMKQRLPMWAEEGLCATAEAYQVDGTEVRFTPNENYARMDDLREAVAQGRLTPLRQLLAMDAGDAVLDEWHGVEYYGQLYGLIHFIRSRPEYRAGLMRMIRDAETGRLNEAMGVTKAGWADLQKRGRTYNRSISMDLFKHYITPDIDGFEKAFRIYARTLTGLY